VIHVAVHSIATAAQVRLGLHGGTGAAGELNYNNKLNDSVTL